MSDKAFSRFTRIIQTSMMCGICLLTTGHSFAQGAPSKKSNADRQETRSKQRVRARPWIGVRLRNRRGGPRIAQVFPNSPAATAGLRAGDFIRRINDVKVSNAAEAIAAIAQLQPDSTVKMRVLRHGKKRTFTVLVGKRPQVRARRPGAQRYRPPARRWAPRYQPRYYYGPAPYDRRFVAPYRYYPPGYYVYRRGPYQYWYYVPGIGIQVGPFGFVF
jgi:hypothetical protein